VITLPYTFFSSSKIKWIRDKELRLSFHIYISTCIISKLMSRKTCIYFTPISDRGRDKNLGKSRLQRRTHNLP